MAHLIDAPAGLEGVVAAETSIGDVRGDEGYYHYRGHSAAALAVGQSFEAVWHLVHRGTLPDASGLDAFRRETAALRPLPAFVHDALPAIATVGSPMSALRTALSLAGQDMRPWLDLAPEQRERQALRLAAITPTLVAALWRVKNGQAPVAPDPSLGLAADYLRMIHGTPPTDEAARAVERYLLLTIDHGFNASTFTARVVASTGADFAAAAVAGVGALSGPLHGGAPSLVVDMLREIGTRGQAREWVEHRLASGQRIMGFGHRVYRTEDPRSAVLKATALALGGEMVDLAVEVERIALELLDTKYPERKLRTNVEFYAGIVLHEIGLPSPLYPPTFAVSRMIGWMAHVLEQTRANRIIRPSSRYVGALHAETHAARV
ncbi:MAG: citrate synthase [Vicinamibacterales bacterium]